MELAPIHRSKLYVEYGLDHIQKRLSFQCLRFECDLTDMDSYSGFCDLVLFWLTLWAEEYYMGNFM